MSSIDILIITSNTGVGHSLERILTQSGYSTTIASDISEIDQLINQLSPSLLILDVINSPEISLATAQKITVEQPLLPLILYVKRDSIESIIQTFPTGLIDYTTSPIRKKNIIEIVKRWYAVRMRFSYQEKTLAELQQKLNELEILSELGRSITASLESDNILASLVDTAVKLTNAEEGSLLLLDEFTGELFMRAARNFLDDFVHTFRLPIQDTLAGAVIQTGQPLYVDENMPQKIKTSYLVHSLLYVPLKLHGKVIGVLGVDNRQSRTRFTKHHEKLLSTIADYAVIAIQNSQLYMHTEKERRKLETILTQVQDGVIVLDGDQKVLWMNKAAIQIFNISETDVVGKPILQIINQPIISFLIKSETTNSGEITTENEQIFSVQLTRIPEIGLVITLHDITHLKKLDRMKSDFVSTVSHDLRSPLTAILGYTDLLERAGPINAQQREFIRRVGASVQNISTLINDLLNLSRIEAGYDSLKEELMINQIINSSLEDLKEKIISKNQVLVMDLSVDLPPLLGNPMQLRQMIDNLAENAIKYTPQGGKIQINTHFESGQIIIKVIDNGPGIPAIDIPYIFDKFFRASNIGSETPGTGLGLSIVKSIVDNHQGRIWVDSKINKGATFTIVFPCVE